MLHLTGTLATLLVTCALAYRASAGPVPPASPTVSLEVAPSPAVDAVVPPLPSIAFSFGPRPASDPLPLSTVTKVGGFVPPEMDWLS
ncbi:hypothetical protein PYCCODRAFT_1470923 [Trametes coccinea BRFM310]|uniref:Uncharacterized protein n=1 Tax=Trametes coccinea (strain BRFM310) TaxID=1353009 RepID=A0A1Y2IBX5_TRAC3|nr:hypothetical protein PYCCODRAFT_1470923 [Trametes coccinea BRFM310]